MTEDSLCWLSMIQTNVMILSEFQQELPVAAMFVTDQDEMSNLYRGPSIDASYQVSVHLTKQFQRILFRN
jgi:hypothetical protein